MRKRQRTDAAAADDAAASASTGSAAGTQAARTSSDGVTVSLRPLRTAAAGAPALTLAHQSALTGVHELKAAYAAHSGLALDRLKLLYSRKPCADTKTLRDVVGADKLGPAATVEFSVMITGGSGSGTGSGTGTGTGTVTDDLVAARSSVQSAAPDSRGTRGDSAVAGTGKEPSPSKSSMEESLGKDEFWRGLAEFLVGRLDNPGEGRRLTSLFRRAYVEDSAAK